MMNDKELVAFEAAKLAKNGMLIGLGTGSTANYFIEHLAKRQTEEGLKISTIASSTISAIKAEACGLSLVAINQVKQINLYVDGADEITPNLTLLKGRGQDLVMEKILAQAADQFIVVADKSKLVNFIGEKFIIPVEVMPNAWRIVKSHLEKNGAEGDIRLNTHQDNIAVTASGNYVLDMRFPRNMDDESLNTLLNNIPGVVEHGVFYKLADKILIADQGIVSSM
jgi:ribose 5-phosphate isomerase A